MSEIEKRKFLIASQNNQVSAYLAKFISKHVSKPILITASEGNEAQIKIENDPPLVVVIQHDLPKKNALVLTQWLLSDRKFSNVCVIILSSIPDTEHFVDEVALGRVQFFEPNLGEVQFGKVLARALNFSLKGANHEYKMRYLSAGEVLISEGEKAENVFIVKRGSLQAQLKRGSELHAIGKIEAGEFVGEMAYINGEPRSADVVAETDCELIEIPIGDLDHMLFQKPAWAKALMKTLSKRVKVGNKTKASAA